MAGTDRRVRGFFYKLLMKSIRSVGIIMDGNRRWAKERGLASFEGHRAGFEALRRLSGDAQALKEKYGLEYVTLYAFSTENWNRTQEEVGYLMQLFEEGLRWIVSEHVKQGEKNPETAIRIKIIGERERFSPALRALMAEAEEKTKNFGGVTVTFALSYGGRAEILDAVKRMQKTREEPTEESFSKALWASGIPDPDIIIRPGGEQRLSNFLPWQGVYSELFFPKMYWPDFTREELEKIFAEYYERERRHGA